MQRPTLGSYCMSIKGHHFVKKPCAVITHVQSVDPCDYEQLENKGVKFYQISLNSKKVVAKVQVFHNYAADTRVMTIPHLFSL